MDDLRATGRDLRAEEWFDAAAVVEAIASELSDHRPACLADLRAEWREPFLLLTIVHADGGVLEVCDGDGHTAISAGDVDFHGYLPADDLVAVLTAGFTGRLTNVRRYRLGYKVSDHFELGGAGGRLVGVDSQGIAGAPGRALRRLPFVRDSVQRTRVRFDHAPACSAAVPA